MKRALLLPLLCIAALGQSNQFRPTLVQSNSAQVPNSCGSSCSLLYLDNVTSGNVLFLGFGAGFALTSISPTDTLSTSYSMGSSLSNGPDTSSGTAGVQVGCGIAGSSGANAVTVASQSHAYEATISEFSGIGTCMTDGTDTADSTLSGGTQSSLTTHPTTTNNNDVCITWGATWWATNNMWSNGNAVGGTGALISSLMDYRIVGAAGSQSITVNINLLSTTPGNAWLIRTQCYTPTFIVATDALPHGAIGSAYTAQLVSAGGSGSSRTWTVTSGSLPTGLSLSAGGALSGTPSGSPGTSSFVVQVSDGTNTKTRTLSIGIGSSFVTPTVAGHAAFAVGPISYSASAGNLLLVGYWGSETGGSHIWTPTITGANNTLTSSPSLSFHRLYPIPGVPGNNQGANGSPVSVYAACIPTTGTYSIDFLVTSDTAFTQFHGSIDAIEVTGAQGIIDDSFVANTAGFASGPASLTVNATAQVPNTLAILFGSNSSSVNSPYTLIDAGVAGTQVLLSGYDLVGSAGSFTGVTNQPCSTNCTDLAMSSEIVPLRPEATGFVCGALGGGAVVLDRPRKPVW